jgi:hypothetical protein
LAILRKAWNDSVWSKVIAAGILAAVAYAAAHWGEVSAIGVALAEPMPVPTWLPLTLVELDQAYAQPNAIPIAPIESHDGETDTR